MTLSLFLALSGPAHAELPVVAWDPLNPPISVHTNGPLDRDWTWSCDDPSDQFPLTQRCQVVDVTDGTVGSGNEIVLIDDDCGTSYTDPTAVNYIYDNPGAIDGRAYFYLAECNDGVGSYAWRARAYFYDTTAPVTTIISGPVDSTATSGDFQTTCAEASYGWDFAAYTATYTPNCRLFCALYNDDTGATVSASASCDDFRVYDDITPGNHTYAGLAPGRYRMEVYGLDGANNPGTPDSWVWEVIADADADGIEDAADNCVFTPNPLQEDIDGDGAGDVCDPCPLDPLDDSDGDGSCDSLDLCVGDDGSGDPDGDGTCSDLDPCPLDVNDDSDGDGSCDSADLCMGFDDGLDADGDGVPDGCDLCIGDDATGDSDSDGTCDDLDMCPGYAELDTDGDGVCDALDPCPFSNPDDIDNDGVCDDVDGCTGPDADGDNVCDDVDPCYGDNASGDVDLDGACALDTDGSVYDCDDGNDTVFPGAAEVCDGLDNDCDTVVPSDEADEDLDGYGICAGDCDDTDPDRFPGNPEVCDGLDNDCDEVVPDDEVDADGDGYSVCGGDCDPTNPSVFPGAVEICDDGIDNNCDGSVDEYCIDPDVSTGGADKDPGNCACSTTGSSWIGWFLLPLAFVRRGR